jgi:hypothetical protein
LFLVEYSSNGHVLHLLTADTAGPNQLEITRDQYVELMERPHEVSKYRVSDKEGLVLHIELTRSLNPMSPITPNETKKGTDILIELRGDSGSVTGTVTFDHSVVMLGVKKNNPQARPFRVEFKTLNSTSKYSRIINPENYDWFIHHPVESFIYSLVIPPVS